VRAPTADREIELKLLVDPADLKAIADRLRECPTAFVRHEAQWLESRYFDTEDQRLAARGVSFRVRGVGRGAGETTPDTVYLQTIKTKGDARGAHSERGEWEGPIDDWTPQPEVVDGMALERLGVVLPEELRLVVTSEIERRTILVEQPVPGGPPAIIEVAFDNGRLVARADGHAAPDRVEAVAEIELELKAGPTRGLYLLLGQLRQWGRLQISTVDKAERGFRLAAGTRAGAVRAKKVTLEREMTTGEALGAILDNCLGQWLRNVPAAADGRDVEGVHQLRIAIRRSRSALSIFAAALDPGVRRAWNQRLKSVITATGPARQHDVFLTQLLPTISATAPAEAGPALAALASRLGAERSTAYDDVRRFLAGREHADLLLDFASWVALEGWQDEVDEAALEVLARPVVEPARALLHKRHKRVKKLGKGFAALTDIERHEVRLALKKLRYGVEFLGDLFPKKAAKRYAKAAAALQDELGILNDQAEALVLLDGVASRAPAKPAAERRRLERGVGFVLGWQAEALAVRRDAATAAWETFIAQRPFWQDKDDDG